MIITVDWVFKIPHEYADCTLSETECDRRQARKVHEFSRFVDMITTLEVTCTEYNPDDSDDGTKQLPDWEWKVEGTHFYCPGHTGFEILLKFYYTSSISLHNMYCHFRCEWRH